MPPASSTIAPWSRCLIARSRMNGSATLWIGIAVITRMSMSVRAVSAPRSMSAFMTVPSMPMLSASARLMPQPWAIRPRK
jgi:hypothetical protein